MFRNKIKIFSNEKKMCRICTSNVSSGSGEMVSGASGGQSDVDVAKMYNGRWHYVERHYHMTTYLAWDVNKRCCSVTVALVSTRRNLMHVSDSQCLIAASIIFLASASANVYIMGEPAWEALTNLVID